MTSKQDDAASQPGEVRSSEGLGLVPERAAFEAWCIARWHGDRGGDNFLRHESGLYAGEYVKGNVQFAWSAWQVANHAERARVLAGVEQRLLTWRQRTMNKSGDRLALDDFMSAETIADLVDHVCDEWA